MTDLTPATRDRPSGGDTCAWIRGLTVTVGAVTALGAAVTALHHVLTTWL